MHFSNTDLVGSTTQLKTRAHYEMICYKWTSVGFYRNCFGQRYIFSCAH